MQITNAVGKECSVSEIRPHQVCAARNNCFDVEFERN